MQLTGRRKVSDAPQPRANVSFIVLLPLALQGAADHTELTPTLMRAVLPASTDGRRNLKYGAPGGAGELKRPYASLEGHTSHCTPPT